MLGCELAHKQILLKLLLFFIPQMKTEGNMKDSEQSITVSVIYLLWLHKHFLCDTSH